MSPKACIVPGWSDPLYQGVIPLEHDGWIGLRLDNLIVVDCDDEAAVEAWNRHAGKPTWERQTPHGRHYIYRRGVDAYTVTAQKLTSIAPKLELKTGVGHQIVLMAPGYSDLRSERYIQPFDPAWLPSVVERDRPIEEWAELPDGIGDTFMISVAGKLREWGADKGTITRCLSAVNEIVMTTDPMGPAAILRLARSAAKYDPAEQQTVDCPKCGTSWETL